MSMLSFAPVAVPVALVGSAGHLPDRARACCAAHERRSAGEGVAGRDAGHRAGAGRGPAGAASSASQTQEYELTGIERWGEIARHRHADRGRRRPGVRRHRGRGRARCGRARCSGWPPQRLYGVSVSAGERGTLHDFEDDGSIRVIAARTDQPFLHETELVPATPASSPARAPTRLGQPTRRAVAGRGQPRAAARARRGSRWRSSAAVIVAASFGLLPVELIASAGAVLMVLTGVLSPRSAARALDPKRAVHPRRIDRARGRSWSTAGSPRSSPRRSATSPAATSSLVVVVFAMTTAVMTNLVTNAATASILTPVGIGHRDASWRSTR